MTALCSPARAQTPGDFFVAPVTGADGTVINMQANLCRPAAPAGAARLVVIAHGSPARAAVRPQMRLIDCGSAAVRWFTGRGYAVAVFLRRGYGATGGSFAEHNDCTAAGYVQAGLETARDIAAAVDAATALPGVRPNGAIVLGQSAGGWGALAYDSQPHPKVAGFISMAGGRGGHVNDEPNHNCHPEALAAAAGQLGAKATTPMLWVYAANDSFFAPPIAAALHQAFTAAGGRAELHQVDAYGEDGHRLFFGPDGATIWGPLIAGYLQRMNLPP